MKLEDVYMNGIEHLFISKSLISKLAAKYLHEYKLFPYFKGLTFDKTNNNPGCYNLNTRQINLNIPLIINSELIQDHYQQILEETQDKVISTEILYYYVLMVLYHELTHVRQNKKMHHLNFFDPIYDTLILSFAMGTKENYETKHDLFPHEHNADACGTAEVLTFMNHYSQNVLFDIDKNVGHMLIKDYLLSDGKVISPIEQLIDKKTLDLLIEKINACSTSDITRLSFGLPISIDTYDQAIKVQEGKEKLLTIDGYSR